MENIIRNNMIQNSTPQQDVVQFQTPDIQIPTFQPEEVEQPIQNNPGNQVLEGQVAYPDNSNKQTNDPVEEAKKILDKQGFYSGEKPAKDEPVEKDENGIPIFEKAATWTKETLVNTKDRAKELAGALGYAFIHPGKAIVQPAINYTKEHIDRAHQAPNDLEGFKVLGEVPVDIANMFLVHPLSGKTIQEIQKEGYKPSDFGEHIHQGRGLDVALTAPLAGSLLSKPINTVGKVARKAIKGTKLDDYLITQDVKKGLRANEVFDRARATQQLRGFKKDLLDKVKEYNINHDNMTQLIKHMRGEEGKNLLNLPENLKPVWEGLKPVVEKYDQILNDIKSRGNLEFTTEAENLMEVFQHLREKTATKGYNYSYQYVKDGMIDSGLLDFGNFVDRTTGKIIKEGNVLNALSEKPIPTEIPNVANLRFEIPEEGLEMLAQTALDTTNLERAGLAKELFESYGLAKAGGLHRISQGLAKIDKSAQLGHKGKVKKQGLFSERVWGNASAEDIAWQWLEPENLFQYGVKGILRDSIVQKWKNDYLKDGKPIVSEYAKPKDIKYVRQDTFFNSDKLDKIDKYALDKIPANMDPKAYIPIDRYTLRAYQELFSPSWMSKKMPIVKDLISLYKQQLLAAGTYLGPNLLGGLHQVITHSNIHLVEDMANAIRTRGSLIGQLGTMREMPIKGDIKAATNPNTWYGKGIRKLNTLNQGLGAWHWRTIDAAIQNTFAEINAHNVFRKLGVKFEDRNLKWLEDNMTKEKMYQAINDIEKQSLIYGDETLIPKPVLDFMEMGNPFIRWPDQATMSSVDMMKKNPIAFGYLQGAVLGGLVWSNNEANAKGMGISNPQAGKIYHFDKDGEKKVTETEVIPIQSSLRLATTPDYFVNAEKNALFSWAMDMVKVKDQYGRLKERAKWSKDLLPDYQRKVRYKNGVITDNAELDEIFANMIRNTVPYRNINGTLAPLIYGAMNKPAYQPYNEQFMVGPGGNPDKPATPEKVFQRLRGEYEHPVIEGKDDELTQKKQAQLLKSANKKQIKRENKRQEDKQGGNK